MADDRPATFSRRDLTLWGLVFTGLLSGTGGSVVAVTQTADRYFETDAARDFRLRDERIGTLRRDIENLSRQVQRIDDTHPPPELIADIDDLEKRMRELEQR